MPGRGSVWVAAWAGEQLQTFSESFARSWLAARQSQNVTVDGDATEYAGIDPADLQ